MGRFSCADSNDARHRFAIPHVGDVSLRLLCAGRETGARGGFEPLGVAAKQDKARAFARIGERQGAPNAA